MERFYEEAPRQIRVGSGKEAIESKGEWWEGNAGAASVQVYSKTFF